MCIGCVGGQVRLYIVPYVSENTPFAPRTRKEISVLYSPPPRAAVLLLM